MHRTVIKTLKRLQKKIALLMLSLCSSLCSPLWLKWHAWLSCLNGTELYTQGNPDLVFSGKGLSAVRKTYCVWCACVSLGLQSRLPAQRVLLFRWTHSIILKVHGSVVTSELPFNLSPEKKAERHTSFTTEQRQNGREQIWVRNSRVMMWLRDYNILWIGGWLGSYENHLALLSVFGKSLDRCLFAINLFPRNKP